MRVSAIPKFEKLLKHRTFHLLVLCIIFLQKSFAQFPSVLDSLSKKIHKIEAKPDFVPTDTTYLKTLIEFGDAFKYTDSDKMLEIAKSLSALLVDANYEKGIPNVHLLFGDYYRIKSQSDSAIVYYKKGIQSIDSQESGDQVLKLKILNVLGYEYSTIGNYSDALSSYLQGIDIALYLDDPLHLSFMYHNIGNVQSRLRNYNLAIQFYNKALDIIGPINEDHFEAEILANLADTLIEDGQLEEAQPHLAEAISIFSENNSIVWLAFAYSNQGKLKLRKEKYDEALNCYLKAAALQESIDEPYERIPVLGGLTETYFKLGKYEKVLEYAQENLELSQSLNSKEGQLNGCRLLYLTHEKLGNISETNFYNEQFEKLSKSLAVDQNQRRIRLIKANQKFGIEKVLELNISKFKEINFKYFFLLFLTLLLSTLFLFRQKLKS